MSGSDEHLANVLGALSLALTDRIRDATEEATGLSGAGPAALVALQQFLAGRPTEHLARATGLTHSGAVRLVDRLVAEGLAERRAGPDGRSVAIALTAKGRAQSRKVTAARADAIETALAPLSAADRRELRRLTDALVVSVTEQRLDARARGDEPAGWLCRMCDFSACGRPQDQCPAADAASRHR